MTDNTTATLEASRISRTIAFQPVLKFTPDKREAFDIDLTEVPESVLGDILSGGVRIILTNTYNSGGKDTPEADRRSNVERRLAAWKRGEYALRNDGPRDSLVGDMREAYITKQVALGKSTKDAEDSIRKTVTAAFGEKEKATFSRFLDAVATLKAKRSGESYDDIRAQLEAESTEAANKLRAEREASKQEVDLDLDNLF